MPAETYLFWVIRYDKSKPSEAWMELPIFCPTTIMESQSTHLQAMKMPLLQLILSSKSTMSLAMLCPRIQSSRPQRQELN